MQQRPGNVFVGRVAAAGEVFQIRPEVHLVRHPGKPCVDAGVSFVSITCRERRFARRGKKRKGTTTHMATGESCCQEQKTKRAVSKTGMINILKPRVKKDTSSSYQSKPKGARFGSLYSCVCLLVVFVPLKALDRCQLGLGEICRFFRRQFRRGYVGLFWICRGLFKPSQPVSNSCFLTLWWPDREKKRKKKKNTDHVHVQSNGMLRMLHQESPRHDGTPVPSLHHVAVITQPHHQVMKDVGVVKHVEPGLPGQAAPAVAHEARGHNIEPGRVQGRQRLLHLGKVAGPAVDEDERDGGAAAGGLLGGLDVRKVHLDRVKGLPGLVGGGELDGGLELRHLVELGLVFPPRVPIAPVRDGAADEVHRHAVFLVPFYVVYVVGDTGQVEPLVEVVQLLVRYFYLGVFFA